MKKKKWILLTPLVILLLAFCLEEAKPYENFSSTVESSPNLTENEITLVVHSLLPIDTDELAKEFIENHMLLNGGRPNQYFELELYRTSLHYKLGKIYDTILCNEKGERVSEVQF